MNNFYFNINTKIYFGTDQLTHLNELKNFGRKVLLVYGGGSIKRNGLYQKVCNILRNNDLEIDELSGVAPNPKIDTVRKGVKLCKTNKIDMVLAVGGGSVIDCAKIIAAGSCYAKDPWDLIENGKKIESSLPIITILTMSATGSEMDPFAVISDLSRNLKMATESQYIRPKLSILNPEFTFSVPKKQTAAGIADIFSHTCENYFNNVKGASIQSHFAEGVFRTVIEFGPIAYNEPNDYIARANLMWASSMAINGIISLGNEVAWSVHPIEHELSAFYDITHGVGLAILTTYWMEYIINKDPKTIDKFVQFGKEVWKISDKNKPLDIAKISIEKTRAFFDQLNLPNKLSQVNIDNTYFEKMAKKASCSSGFCPLSKDDVLEILKMAL